MALIKEIITVDGRQVLNHRQDPIDKKRPVVQTGPIQGTITLDDGTVYDVTDHYVETAHADHAAELTHRINVRHEQDGHPDHLPRGHEDYHPLVDEFHHICTAVCGKHARTLKQHEDDFAARLERLGHKKLVGTAEHKAVVARIRAAHKHTNSEG